MARLRPRPAGRPGIRNFDFNAQRRRRPGGQVASIGPGRLPGAPLQSPFQVPGGRTGGGGGFLSDPFAPGGFSQRPGQPSQGLRQTPGFATGGPIDIAQQSIEEQAKKARERSGQIEGLLEGVRKGPLATGIRQAGLEVLNQPTNLASQILGQLTPGLQRQFAQQREQLRGEQAARFGFGGAASGPALRELFSQRQQQQNILGQAARDVALQEALRQGQEQRAGLGAAIGALGAQRGVTGDLTNFLSQLQFPAANFPGFGELAALTGQGLGGGGGVLPGRPGVTNFSVGAGPSDRGRPSVPTQTPTRQPTKPARGGLNVANLRQDARLANDNALKRLFLQLRNRLSRGSISSNDRQRLSVIEDELRERGVPIPGRETPRGQQLTQEELVKSMFIV